MKLAPNNRRHAPKRFRIQTTYCQAKLPTVRQAFSRYETCTQQPHTLHPNVSADLHPTTAYMHPNVAAYMHPKGIDMHPKVSIDLHPTTAYFAPNRSIDMHPKGAYMHPKVAAYMHKMLSCFWKIVI